MGRDGRAVRFSDLRRLAERVLSVAMDDLGDGEIDDPAIVYQRLRRVTANVALLAAVAVVSRVTGSPAIELVSVAMLGIGWLLAWRIPSERDEILTTCRERVWFLLGSAFGMAVLIAWSTSDSGMGLPNLLGVENSEEVARSIGGGVLVAMFVVDILLLPLAYVRQAVQTWRLSESREDTVERITRTSRGRRARRF